MSRTVQTCNKIMVDLVSRGFTNQVSMREVKKAIVRVVGVDSRTIKNWLNALEVLGFLKRRRANLFVMNFDECPELLVKVLHGERQKKLL